MLCMHACMYVYVCMYVYMYGIIINNNNWYVCMYDICMYVCMYVCCVCDSSSSIIPHRPSGSAGSKEREVHLCVCVSPTFQSKLGFPHSPCQQPIHSSSSSSINSTRRGGGGEGSFRRSPLYLSDLSDHQSSITTTAEEEEEKGFIFYPSDIFEPTRKQ